MWSADGSGAEATVLELAGLIGDADPTDLWLDAKHDAALVGDGDRVWLLTHDGAGSFADPVELGAGLAGAALLNVPAAADAPVDKPGDLGDADPATDPDAAGPLPAPIVVAAGRTLRLVAAEGTATTLVELSAEGESTFVAASVRPGSRPDDLTVVSLTTAEGTYDLRLTRVVDGEVVVAFDALEGSYAPAVDAVFVGRPPRRVGPRPRRGGARRQPEHGRARPR